LEETKKSFVEKSVCLSDKMMMIKMMMQYCCLQIAREHNENWRLTIFQEFATVLCTTAVK